MDNGFETTALKQLIATQLTTAAERKAKRELASRVYFDCLLDGFKEKAKLVNEALAECDKDARLQMATELLRLWAKGTDDQVREVLGECVNVRGSRSEIFTLTGDGRQLRVWYGFPGHISYDHVDSCGYGLLFGIYGPPDVVKQYLDAFLGVVHLAPAQGKDGSTIYVGF
jgi:hypothetical protein